MKNIFRENFFFISKFINILFSKFELKNLYIKGQEGDKFYIILSGEVGVFIQKEYKREEGVEELLSQKNLLKK